MKPNGSVRIRNFEMKKIHENTGVGELLLLLLI